MLAVNELLLIAVALQAIWFKRGFNEEFKLARSTENTPTLTFLGLALVF